MPLWETINELEKMRIEFDVTTVEDLDRDKYSALILPRTVAITDNDVVNLREFKGDIVVTDQSGTLNMRGEKRNKTLKELLSSDSTRVIDSTTINYLESFSVKNA